MSGWVCSAERTCRWRRLRWNTEMMWDASKGISATWCMFASLESRSDLHDLTFRCHELTKILFSCINTWTLTDLTGCLVSSQKHVLRSQPTRIYTRALGEDSSHLYVKAHNLFSSLHTQGGGGGGADRCLTKQKRDSIAYKPSCMCDDRHAYATCRGECDS